MGRKIVKFLLVISVIWSSCKPNSHNAQNRSFQPVDEVYPLLDAANSRWFFFASASRPFGMVTLNPDTQTGGAWGSGYRYDTDTIKGLSHIHGWQIAGISVLPVSFDGNPEDLKDDFYSPFSHEKEVAEVGYHKLELEKYAITAELTSTKRVGFHRYRFNNEEAADRGIVFQMAGNLGPSLMKDGRLEMIDSKTLKGEITNGPTRRRPKDFKVFYIVKLDQEVTQISDFDASHVLLEFAGNPKEVKMKVGVSYTSYENAKLNLESELNGWDFEEVVMQSKEEWNRWLGKVDVGASDSLDRRRFYTDLWHALQGRRTISDVNGQYPNYMGAEFQLGQVPLDEDGNPEFAHYNSDSFWGAQWTINTLWGLLYPEVYSEFVKSMMLYYKDGGLLPRGPSGGNYTYVMTGASSTPFIVSAFQKNIDIGNKEEVYQALKKNHLKDGIMSKAGYEHDTNIGGGLDYYMSKGYVPYPIPEGKYGFHQDGASLTLEYAYQDFTLAQMAKALGEVEDYEYFMSRSLNYRNVFDSESGWIRPKDVNGVWRKDFDPYQYESGFNESNSAQSTWFVGHDIKGLADLMGGPKKAVDKLNGQFEEAAERGFTSGDSHERGEDPTLARIPINYGNQPSIQTAFIFNELGRPDLSQYWSTEVVDKTFSGLSPYVGYKGDEDQGLMGSLAVLMKLGLFQINGGTEANPAYSITPPLFREVSLSLPGDKTLKIMKEGEGPYIEQIVFNSDTLGSVYIKHFDLIKGGVLRIKMRK